MWSLFLLAYYVVPIFRHQVYLNPVYLNAKCVQTHVPCSSSVLHAHALLLSVTLKLN